MSETAYLIERNINGIVHYWGGHSAGDWRRGDQHGIRFSREVDAQTILDWLLRFQGQVVEHMGCDAI